MIEALRHELPWLLGVLALSLLGAGMGTVWGVMPWAVYAAFQWVQATRVLQGRVPFPVGVWPVVAEHYAYLLGKQQKRAARREKTLLQFEQMLKTLPLGVIRLDDHNAIAWANDSAVRLLKLQSEDRGKPIQHLLRLPEFVQWLEQSPQLPLKLVMPEAKLYVLQFELLPFDKGQLMLVRDITAEYDLDQVRQDFVANASHELRTPVTVFIGYLETFLSMSDHLPEHLRRAMEQMQQQAQRMQQVIEDLLILSSIERMETLQDEQVRVADLFQQLEQEAQQLSRGRHRQIFSTQPGWSIRGEPALLRSICSNLVSNAIRYTPEEGTIEVRWYVDAQGQGIFEVRDTGIGIPREHLSRLTERFYRVDKARSREQGGTGLGLAIVKHALEQHDGHLVIESTPQLGSTFKAVFPASRVTEVS